MKKLLVSTALVSMLIVLVLILEYRPLGTVPSPSPSPTPSPSPSPIPSPSPSPSPTPGNKNYTLIDSFQNILFRNPVGIYDSLDGTDRLFVVEQGGVIKLLRKGGGETGATMFLDISSKVVSGSEMGLLGLAFHPQFRENGLFYVDYTAPYPLRTVIARYSVNSSNPDQADPRVESMIMEIMQPYMNHNGGQLAFGPDGYLYIAMGDGGGAGDPQGNAQNLSSLLGKILRIDVDKRAPSLNYSIPIDNPFAGNAQGFREEIYAYGLRNPWRFSFDTDTGLLWAGDVGQGRIEEVDVIEKGGNYGWNVMEGTLCYSQANCDPSRFLSPVWEYNHSLGISVIGGFVYRGLKLPELVGSYIFGDYGSGRIWALSYNGSHINVRELVRSGLSITSLGVDSEGELYICTTAGRIYTLTYFR